MEHVLTITQGADGEITVAGPIGNKVLAYGMLDVARDLIQSYVPSGLVLPANSRNGT